MANPGRSGASRAPPHLYLRISREERSRDCASLESLLVVGNFPSLLPTIPP